MAYYEEQDGQAPVQQRQPQVAPYIQEYQSGHADLVKLALNSSDLMEELRLNLLAQEWDAKEKKFITNPSMMSLIKETGAQKIITVVSSFVNRNAHLSNVVDEDIRAMCQELELNICNDFFDHWATYWENEWEAESNWPIVRSMAGNTAKLALLRAKNGREMTALSGATKMLISQTQMDSSQKITEMSGKRFSNLFK